MNIRIWNNCVTIMAESSSGEEVPVASRKMKMDAYPISTIDEFLTKCDGFQLFQLTKFYQDRLEQAIEEGVEGLWLTLMDADQFIGQEYHHKLLPGCSVLVTSWLTAFHLLEKAEIGIWAEILGFVGDQCKEYFNKFFEDQTVAAAVFKHVEENEILYSICYNPSYCWILGLSLVPFFTEEDKKKQQVPKTITQLYSYYIYNILKNHGREIGDPRDVFLKLGEMAFTGVSEKLHNAKLGDSGVRLLCAGLKSPDCKIERLGLTGNGLTDSCAEDLASALSINQSLTHLDLTSNSFTDRSAPFLYCLIQTCKSLKAIQMHHNGLSDSYAEDLSSTRSINQSLIYLDLSENSFTDQSVPFFQRLIRTCRRLRYGAIDSVQMRRQLKLLESLRPNLTVSEARNTVNLMDLQYMILFPALFYIRSDVV
ncbi:hypothetical protein chiPu_0011704 [Chiloscyllium punctatum]|uniref:NACHT LRR and PYD domain-containing protein n=1 Tax=Chiloscyllium punctatum TaxID=137246 RepID=A0A401SS87_CHIPU|nr:hypothetical protein [Chiloscyllium punctatum]